VRLLLDTHALLWYATADRKLTPLAQSLIKDGANEILISLASYWEIAIKISVAIFSFTSPTTLSCRHAITNMALGFCPSNHSTHREWRPYLSTATIKTPLTDYLWRKRFQSESLSYVPTPSSTHTASADCGSCILRP